jgi:hypothetical protein
LGGEPPRDRDGVIKFQRRQKISSILIRNTVVPIAIRTTSGSCSAIEDVKSPKIRSCVVMSIISLDIQRRCEQRWAARFARRVPPSAPHEHIDEKPNQQLALPGKTKKKTRRAKAAGLKSAPAV